MAYAAAARSTLLGFLGTPVKRLWFSARPTAHEAHWRAGDPDSRL